MRCLLLLLLALACALDSAPLSPALRSALAGVVAEGGLLIQRLDAFRARVRARLHLEEAIELNERVHRASLQLTPLPTAVPRAFEPGDAHVALEELPGLAALSADTAHAFEHAAQQTRVARAQAAARGAPPPPPSPPAPPPPMTREQRLAARMGVLLARVRALPLLRLHGMGVEEDYQGRVSGWARNVTLEQMLATAPGWQYATTAGRQGAGYQARARDGPAAAPQLHPMVQERPPPAAPTALSPETMPLLGLAYWARPWARQPPGAAPRDPAASTASAASAAEAEAAAEEGLGQSIYLGGPARTLSMLAGVPLLAALRGPGAAGAWDGSGGGAAAPQRFLPSTAAPLDSAYTAQVPTGAMLLDPARGALPFSRRPRLNPAVTNRFGLLTPLVIAFTAEEAWEAGAVRALQAVGVAVAPARGAWEGLAWVTRAVVPRAWLQRARAWGGSAAAALAWHLPAALVEAGEGALWRAAGWAGLQGSATLHTVVQAYFEAAFAARRVWGGAAARAAWAWGVVWGTGAEIFCCTFPAECLDARYRRAEVTALHLALGLAEDLERALRAQVAEAQAELQAAGAAAGSAPPAGAQ